MLRNLYIKNFILIDELNMDFNNDFSVFTGETGAGKSIFIDSISILCGDKLTTSMIKTGRDKAVIEGTFDVNPSIASKLEEAGYDNECMIVSREIDRDGKSVTRLNQRSCTVSFIKECLSEIIDIHCQHDNQYLLNEKYHRQLLDRFGQNEQLLQQVNNAYKEYHLLTEQLDEAKNKTYNPSQLEVIKYQLNEISTLAINDINEDEKIEEQLKNALEIEKTKQTVSEIKDLFDNDGILSKLYQFTKISCGIASINEISTNVENIKNSYYNIMDDYEIMMKKLDVGSFDESELNELNQRLYDLQKAKRKYGTSLQGLKDLQQDLQNQIDAYENREYVISQLEKQISLSLQNYQKYAAQLSEKRRHDAAVLQEEIIAQCADLSLNKAKFEVSIKECGPSAKGSDEIAFRISMNPGEPLQPLIKVASGGELSRLMLALKVIFARLQGTELVIFDEIDTGVSGPVALAIGVKMAQLSRNMQVFAITHLSSVAACGDRQYLICKTQSEDSTVSELRLLNQQDRIQQLAILSSSDITDASLVAAGELLNKAQSLSHQQ